MKQHITIEQLNEIQDYKEFSKISGIHIAHFHLHTELHKVITIGKMIEILQDKICYFNMTNMYVCTDGVTTPGWGIFKPENFDIRADELCDALWETVKRIL